MCVCDSRTVADRTNENGGNMESKVISREYVKKNYIHKNKILKLKEKLENEYQCAIKGFMKKQIVTSVVDGTIAQETGWILQEIDKILEGTKDADK